MAAGLAAWIGAGLTAFGAGGAMGQSWDAVARPSIGPAQIFGGYANGCIAGAVQLPLDGGLPYHQSFAITFRVL